MNTSSRPQRIQPHPLHPQQRFARANFRCVGAATVSKSPRGYAMLVLSLSTSHQFVHLTRLSGGIWHPQPRAPTQPRVSSGTSVTQFQHITSQLNSPSRRDSPRRDVTGISHFEDSPKFTCPWTRRQKVLISMLYGGTPRREF